MSSSTSERELAGAAGDVLKRTGRTLAVAESCTGGMVAMFLTSVPGASAWFSGGVVCYSDGLKTSLLGVPHALLMTHGAVSRETASAMAAGVRTLVRSDIAISLTGVAGPSGGTPEKPVGTVFMALDDGKAVRTWMERFTGDRDAVRKGAAMFILCRLLERLEAEAE